MAKPLYVKCLRFDRLREIADAVRKCRDGLAATEFALIMPLMGTMFFGMLEGADALTVSRRVASASNSLVDLVAQETEITEAEVDNIFVGIENMLERSGDSTLNVSLTSVIRDPDDPDNVIVHWSRDQSGSAPYSPGQAFDKLENENVLKEGVSLIFVELNYDYRSNLTHKVFGAPITFNRQASRWPRRSTRVQLCTSEPDPEDRTCTS